MCQQPNKTNVDLREALYNDRPVGPAAAVQAPAERITTLHGFVVDLDPGLYAPGNAIFTPADDPREFFRNILPMLDRHPVLRSAQVRMTGTGLHLIVYMTPAVELKSADDQERWGAVVRAVQCSVPSDPDAPGVTTLTRPVGSVNGKNGATVELLRQGEPVAPGVVEAFVAKLVEAPFRGVAVPLLGGERVTPCPICDGPDTRLDVLDFAGKCYGGCGNVTIQALFDRVFRAEEVNAK